MWKVTEVPDVEQLTRLPAEPRVRYQSVPRFVRFASHAYFLSFSIFLSALSFVVSLCSYRDTIDLEQIGVRV